VRPPLPVAMAAAVARQDAADRQALELAEAAREDEAPMRAIVARNIDAQHEAQTGYSVHEWQAARQAALSALADAGHDPSAVVGTAAHPEVLVEGASLHSLRQAEDAAVARYDVTGVDAQLQRCADERAAWSSPPIMRQRRLSVESEGRRGGAVVFGRRPRRAGRPAQGDLWPRDITRTVPDAFDY
jgi:hypothetical protein